MLNPSLIENRKWFFSLLKWAKLRKCPKSVALFSEYFISKNNELINPLSEYPSIRILLFNP